MAFVLAMVWVFKPQDDSPYLMIGGDVGETEALGMADLDTGLDMELQVGGVTSVCCAAWALVLGDVCARCGRHPRICFRCSGCGGLRCNRVVHSWGMQ